MRFLAALVFATAAAAAAQDVHVHVDPNGHGSIASTTDYTTIQQALDHAPEAPRGRIFIHIAPGTYKERINVTRNRPRITLLGEGKRPEDVVITAAQFARQAGGTFFTETAQITGDAFEADNLSFENSAFKDAGRPVGQAVAAAVRSDRAIFKHCRFIGDQDTLFADFGRQYYVDSYIEGGVDFIFGNATAVFDHTEIHEFRPGFLTAQSRTSPDQTTGYVITNSKVTVGVPPESATLPERAVPPASALPNAKLSPYDDGVFRSPPANDRVFVAPSSGPPVFFLGRPWRLFSRVIVMNSDLPPSLHPAGWSIWSKNDPAPKAFYAEYNNTGPGFRPKERARWSHQLTAAEAATYAPENFLRGGTPDQPTWDPIAEAAKLP